MYLSGENSQNVYLVKSIDSINDGAKTPAKSDEIVLRYVADLDTFTKRSGNTTYFTPGADQGGWIRFGYRNLGVDGIGKVNGNTYELGYTKVLDDKENYKHRFSSLVPAARKAEAGKVLAAMTLRTPRASMCRRTMIGASLAASALTL